LARANDCGDIYNAADAASAFESATPRLQATERLSLFGETLFITGSAQTEWPDWLKARGAKTFIERPGSNAMAFVLLQCRAADENPRWSSSTNAMLRFGTLHWVNGRRG